MEQNVFTLNRDRMVRMPEVQMITGRSRSSIYEDMRHDRFPQSVKLGPRAVAWRLSEINFWMASLA